MAAKASGPWSLMRPGVRRAETSAFVVVMFVPGGRRDGGFWAQSRNSVRLRKPQRNDWSALPVFSRLLAHRSAFVYIESARELIDLRANFQVRSSFG
jgi:hypothetical protein